MLSKLYAKIITLVILGACSGTAFADIFTIPPDDKSKEYLGMIFGGSVGGVSLGGNVNFTIFSAMMEKFNLVMLVFGVIFLTYVTVISTINTAREGEALGKKFSLFTIFRPLMGILLMVPSHGSGYSVMQMSVMWIILNGIGLADAAWNTILQHLSYGANISTNVNYGGAEGTKITPYHLNDLTQAVMASCACQNVLNNEMPELRTIPGVFQQHGPVKIYVVPKKIQGNTAVDDSITQTAEVKVGLEGAHGPYDHVCGKFLVSVELKRADQGKIEFSTTNLSNRLAIKVQALRAMFQAVDPVASLISKNVPIEHLDPGYVNAAGEAYINQMTAVTKHGALKKSRASFTEEQKQLRRYGWIHAGSYYHVLTNSRTTDLDPELTIGKRIDIPSTAIPEEVGRLLTDAHNFNQHQKFSRAIAGIKSFWEKDRPLRREAQFGNEEKPSRSIRTENATTTDAQVNYVIGQTVNGIKVPFERYLASIKDGDPLLAISRFGTALALDHEQSAFSQDIIRTLNRVGGGLNTGPFLKEGYGVVAGIRYLIIIIGATLGIYVPLVPYLVFLISAFGWFIMVIESIFLCPMLSLAFCYPTEEVLSKITHGLFIIMNVFLRPILMVFGFIAGITLMRAGFSLVNFGFISALNAGTTATIFSILAVLVVYVFIVITIVNKAFSLIYLLANQIMRWIGGQPEHTDTDALVREVKTGFDSTVGRDQALMNRAAAGAGAGGRVRRVEPPAPPF